MSLAGLSNRKDTLDLVCVLPQGHPEHRTVLLEGTFKCHPPPTPLTSAGTSSAKTGCSDPLMEEGFPAFGGMCCFHQGNAISLM